MENRRMREKESEINADSFFEGHSESNLKSEIEKRQSHAKIGRLLEDEKVLIKVLKKNKEFKWSFWNRNEEISRKDSDE